MKTNNLAKLMMIFIVFTIFISVVAAGENDYDSLINQYGNKYNLNPLLIKALIKQESQFNPNAISGSGASGLMQIMPDNYAKIAAKLNLPSTGILTPEHNIHAGTYYLAYLTRYFERGYGYYGERSGLVTTKAALASYNGGYAYVAKATQIWLKRKGFYHLNAHGNIGPKGMAAMKRAADAGQMPTFEELLSIMSEPTFEYKGRKPSTVQMRTHGNNVLQYYQEYAGEPLVHIYRTRPTLALTTPSGCDLNFAGTGIYVDPSFEVTLADEYASLTPNIDLIVLGTLSNTNEFCAIGRDTACLEDECSIDDQCTLDENAYNCHGCPTNLYGVLYTYLNPETCKMETVTDPDGVRTRFDEEGRVTFVDYPNGGSIDYAYDLGTNDLSSVTIQDPDSLTARTTFHHNSLGYLTTAITTLAEERVSLLNYAYYGDGTLRRYTNLVYTNFYNYDANDNPIMVTDVQDQVKTKFLTTFSPEDVEKELRIQNEEGYPIVNPVFDDHITEEYTCLKCADPDCTDFVEDACPYQEQTKSQIGNTVYQTPKSIAPAGADEAALEESGVLDYTCLNTEETCIPDADEFDAEGYYISDRYRNFIWDKTEGSPTQGYLIGANMKSDPSKTLTIDYFTQGPHEGLPKEYVFAYGLDRQGDPYPNKIQDPLGYDYTGNLLAAMIGNEQVQSIPTGAAVSNLITGRAIQDPVIYYFPIPGESYAVSQLELNKLWSRTIGEGTPDFPYLIFDCQELQDIGSSVENLKASHALATNIDCSDISNFDPIGYDTGAGDDTWFTGNFDGNNHKITNLKIDRTEDIGLFGVTADGTIKNVILENVDITGRYRVGALIGSNMYSTVDNVKVTGTITFDSSLPSTFGGLVGINSGTITNSETDVEIIGGSYLGGFVGENRGTIEDSSSAGKVTGDTYVGGFVGYNYGTIRRCSTSTLVIGNEYAGDFYGYNEGILEDIEVIRPSVSETITKILTPPEGITPKLVIGLEPGDDKLTSINLAGSLKTHTITSDEITPDDDYLILIGGPCANAATADVLDTPTTWPDCTQGFETGKGLIQTIRKDNKYYLLVAGMDAINTRVSGQAIVKQVLYNQFTDQFDTDTIITLGSDLNNPQIE